jgi:hypothetical protein
VGRYQLAFWFRIERFPAASEQAHLVTFMTQRQHGVNVFLTNERLQIRIADRRSRGADSVEYIPIEVELHSRVWYYLDIQVSQS